MYRIQTMNKISPVGLNRFPAELYEVSDTVQDPQGILVRSAKLLDMEFNPGLLAIARAGVGVNNIPLDRCAEAGIPVFSTPGANANAVKELVICAMLIGSRDIPGAIRWVREQAASGIEVSTVVEKGKSAFVGPELYKKTIGIIGLGAIGSIVANAAISLGMDVYGYDFHSKREEREFPLKRTQYEKLYLDAASRTAAKEPFVAQAEVEYDPETELVTFDYKFEEETEITGYMKLRLWVEARGHDNMDMFVWVKKLGENGEEIPIHSMNEPYRGAWGYLRASRRELDPKLATDFQPILAHKQDLKLAPGEIVPVDIEIWPHSRIWHKGESIRIEVEGRFWMSEWYEDPKMHFVTDNGEGKHVIHTGGEYESFLQIPVIPPRYKCGDYIYR